MPTDLETFKNFVTEEQASSGYQSWAQANCGAYRNTTPKGTVQLPLPGTELDKWYGFRNKILAGVVVPVPVMLTHQGRALLDAAQMAAPEVAPPPDPTKSQAFWREDFEDNALDTSVLLKWSQQERIVDAPWGGGGKGILLPTVDGTVSSGAPNSQMSSVYMNAPNARAQEGSKVAYGIDIFFPADFLPTEGQWNWMGMDWHISGEVPQNVAGTRAASCGVGWWSNFTDRNDGKLHGPTDWVYVARMEGGDPANPYGSDVNAAGDYHAISTMAEMVGKKTRLIAEMYWTQNMDGYGRWYINGQLRWEYKGPTLFRLADGSSDHCGWGIYNYHPIVPREIDITFDNLVLGPDVASVS